MRKLLSFLLALAAIPMLGQTNMQFTNATAEQVLLGNFSPQTYQQSTVINHPTIILPELVNQISADSLKASLEIMAAFGNRNTGSDTSSTTFGIGAARRWAHQKFNAISALNENRLLVTYLQFDEDICNVSRHRNILGILPGTGPQHNEVVIVEAHLDSRCEDPCDSLCLAEGMEDNGSGSALVMELARVMSQFSYNRTIVFMLTIGEEQGLFGAEAMAAWCENNNIDVHAVFNNDVIGGIICGETASPPGCPGLNDIDSVNVRIYSLGNYDSHHKSLARFTKLEYAENINPLMPFEVVINLMTPEDRAGRGGDHMPFRAHGYPAIRFTSANEHGHGAPDAAYDDRQHTVEDILGLDTDNDGQLDTFFVDFNYLRRNAIINGDAIACAAMGPVPPVSFIMDDVPDGLRIQITDLNNYGVYRVGVRSTEHDFDTIYTITNVVDTLYDLNPQTYYRISACTVDSNGIESLFSNEDVGNFQVGLEELGSKPSGVELLQNKPNPFDEATTITVHVSKSIHYKQAQIVVRDLQGKEIGTYPISLDQEMNEVVYDHAAHRYKPGVFSYTLVIDGREVATRRMIFAY